MRQSKTGAAIWSPTTVFFSYTLPIPTLSKVFSSDTGATNWCFAGPERKEYHMVKGRGKYILKHRKDVPKIENEEVKVFLFDIPM